MYKEWKKYYTNKHYNINQNFDKKKCRLRTQRDYENKQYNITQNLLKHEQRMDINRLPVQALQYNPKVATTYEGNGEKQTNKKKTKL